MLDGTIGLTRVASDGEELIDEMLFASLGTTYYLNNGNTALGIGISQGHGNQDFDLAPPGDTDIDPTRVRQLTLSAEHMLPGEMLRGATSIYGEVSRVWVEENNIGNILDTDDIDETRLTIGFRVLFGADNLQTRDSARAPELPDVARWQAIAPALD